MHEYVSPWQYRLKYLLISYINKCKYITVCYVFIRKEANTKHKGNDNKQEDTPGTDRKVLSSLSDLSHDNLPSDVSESPDIKSPGAGAFSSQNTTTQPESWNILSPKTEKEISAEDFKNAHLYIPVSNLK